MTQTTVTKLQENNIEIATDVGFYMDSLINDGGLTPSEARSKALTDLLPHTRDELSDYLGITTGAIDGSASKAEDRIKEAHRLHFLIEGYPKHLLKEIEVQSKTNPEWVTRYFILEAAELQSEDSIEEYLDDPEVDAQDIELDEYPRYCVYIQNINPNRASYQIHNVEMNKYTSSELVQALYDDRKFDTIEQATKWKGILTNLGFDVESPPEERLRF